MTDYTKQRPTATTHGLKGGALTPSNSADFAQQVKAVEVTVGGTLIVLPLLNADGDWINLGTCAKGYRPPYQIRRIREDSTATCVGVWD